MSERAENIFIVTYKLTNFLREDSEEEVDCI